MTSSAMPNQQSIATASKLEAIERLARSSGQTFIADEIRNVMQASQSPSTGSDDLVERVDYLVKMARQYEAAVIRVPDAIHGAGERLEQAKRELLNAIPSPDRVEVLEEALRPFAAAADDCGVTDSDDEHFVSAWEHPVAMNVKVGDFYRAAAALNPKESGQ